MRKADVHEHAEEDDFSNKLIFVNFMVEIEGRLLHIASRHVFCEVHFLVCLE